MQLRTKEILILGDREGVGRQLRQTVTWKARIQRQVWHLREGNCVMEFITTVSFLLSNL